MRDVTNELINSYEVDISPSEYFDRYEGDLRTELLRRRTIALDRLTRPNSNKTVHDIAVIACLPVRVVFHLKEQIDKGGLNYDKRKV